MRTYPSLTIGAGNLRLLSFYDQVSGADMVLVGRCNDLQCSSATFAETILGSSVSSVTISPSGNPLVSFKNTTFSDVSLCGSWFCTTFFRRR